MRRHWIALAGVVASSHSRHGLKRLALGPTLAASAGWTIAFATALSALVAVAEDGIFVMKIDGSEERKVASVDGIEHHTSPRWSHDGRRLAFETLDDNGVEKSFIVNLDGTGLKEIGEMGSPDWSPDDKQIVFHYSGANMQHGSWVRNVDGEGLNWLGSGAYPRWSPDGGKIAYCDDVALRVLDLVQENELLLTEDPFAQRPGCFEWSRDGKRLAFFTRTVPGGPRNLYVISAEAPNKGLEPRFSRQGFKVGGHVTWSADDKQLFFTIESYIHVLTVDGKSQPVRVGGQPDKSRDPACSPDGKSLAFARRPD
jgi:Tol biopolymer transport system component